MSATEVPPRLRRGFVVYFVADLTFALPLMVAPARVLGFFGWTAVDPKSTLGKALRLGHRPPQCSHCRLVLPCLV